MGKIRTVLPAALIAGITWADERILEDAVMELEKKYGSIEQRI
jgi:hypothetical protein